MLGGVLRLDGVDALQGLTAFERVIAEPGPWAGAFDSPFGLPRAFVEDQALVDDASGDRLDAALCLAQAAWASVQPEWGMPAGANPVEGWIVTA